ncbi:MAG: hypothetical protein ACOC3S_00225 [Bacteroidota bacterium]
MKQELQVIIDRINSFGNYNDVFFEEYKLLVKEALKVLGNYKGEASEMLDTWKDMAIGELTAELDNRLENGFLELKPEKKKSEFIFSKSTVSLSLTNVLMHL